MIGVIPEHWRKLIQLDGGDPFDHAGARDGYSRPVVDGDSMRRPSTQAKALDTEQNLADWKARFALYGLARQPMLTSTIAGLDPDTQEFTYKMKEIVELCMDASGANYNRERGNLIHMLTEYVDGKPIPPEATELFQQCMADEEILDAIQAYTATMDQIGFKRPTEWVEVSLAWPTEQLAGTADRIVVAPNGKQYILDIKTGKKTSLRYSWLSWVLQLWIYANAEYIYNPATNTRLPMPDVEKDVGYICHVDADNGECSIYRLDLTPARHAYELSQQVEEARSQAIKFVTKVTELPTVETPRELLDAGIDLLKAVDGGLETLMVEWRRLGLPKPGALDDDQTRIALGALTATLNQVAGKPVTREQTEAWVEHLPGDLADGVDATARGLYNCGWDDDPVPALTGFVYAHLLTLAEEALEARRAALNVIGHDEGDPKKITKRNVRSLVAIHYGLIELDDAEPGTRKKLIDTAVGSKAAGAVKDAGREAARWCDWVKAPTSAKQVYADETLCALILGQPQNLEIP